HGAGAAGAAVADTLAAGDVEVVAQRVQQGDARLDVGGHRRAVDVEGELDGRRPHADGFVLGGGRVAGERQRGRNERRRRGGGAGAAREVASPQAGGAGAPLGVVHDGGASLVSRGAEAPPASAGGFR